MKPVVSSLVALVISLAPLSAMAAKPVHHSKTAHVQKKADDKSASADKSEKSEKLIHVKATKKDGASMKTAVHHAKDVDLGGPAHHEPKIEKADHKLVPASMTSKIAEPTMKPSHSKDHSKAKPAPSTKDMPKLPAPNAGKSGNGGRSAEKGAKKPSEKKADKADDASGEPTRDEELAELVARIRGVEPTKSATQHVSQKTHVVPPPKTCLKEPVEIVRGPEVERFELTKCDGSIAPAALERFSVLIRPGGAARPTAPPSDLAKKPGPDIAPGIRRVDSRLVERVEQVAEHFGKAGAPAKLFVISGYRPASIGSMHSTGRAMDFRVEGAKNEDVVAFCKTITDTGCGYYPNSSFVHMDVRDVGTGHTAWIDASGPGETPRYVTQWPLPDKKPLERASATEPVSPGLAEEGEDILRAKRPTDEMEPPVPVDEHPATPSESP